MKNLILVLSLLSLAACGAETAGTAATAASLKKQEVEQGQIAVLHRLRDVVRDHRVEGSRFPETRFAVVEVDIHATACPVRAAV